MITSKQELNEFLERDRLALHQTRSHPRSFGDDVWKYQIRLRKTEWYWYSGKRLGNPFNAVRYLISKCLLSKRALKLGFTIPINVFDKGLSIAHYGTIVVNDHSKVGQNCRIQECVNLGATGGNSLSPIVGNNVFIGTGAKLIGGITVADGVSIAANAVVVKDILEPNTTWGGVPQKSSRTTARRILSILVSITLSVRTYARILNNCASIPL